MKITFLQVHSLMKVTFNEATHSKNTPERWVISFLTIRIDLSKLPPTQSTIESMILKESSG